MSAGTREHIPRRNQGVDAHNASATDLRSGKRSGVLTCTPGESAVAISGCCPRASTCLAASKNVCFRPSRLALSSLPSLWSKTLSRCTRSSTPNPAGTGRGKRLDPHWDDGSSIDGSSIDCRPRGRIRGPHGLRRNHPPGNTLPARTDLISAGRHNYRLDGGKLKPVVVNLQITIGPEVMKAAIPCARQPQPRRRA